MFATARHATALTRYELSRPFKIAEADQLLQKSRTIFDYGCGKGSDVSLLSGEGFDITGFDPHYAPNEAHRASDIVNLGYVINVIEDPNERATVLNAAFRLTRYCLIVSAQVLNEDKQSLGKELNDGVITQKGTFQKYFTQSELKAYIDGVLNADSIPASPGIFYVFKKVTDKESFVSESIRSHRILLPRNIRTLEAALKPHESLLQSYVQAIQEHGRVPLADEFGQLDEIKRLIGGPKRSLAICEKYFGDFDFEEIAERRYEDMVVYLALIHFRCAASGVPKLNALPKSVQADIKQHFNSYKYAIHQGMDLLVQIGDADTVDMVCKASSIGKLLPDDLYVHRDYIDHLDPVLRVYFGCAKLYSGDVPEANIIKFHRKTGKLSFLAYPNFDSDPHPQLQYSCRVDFKRRQIDERDYSASTNPPILHRKETFVDLDYPQYDAFKSLTECEVQADLLGSNSIGFKNQWEELLASRSLKIADHKLMRDAKDSD